MTKHLLASMVLLFLVSCSDDGFAPEDRIFNIQLKYGIGGNNELNTFRNIFTKDLILDGTASTSMVLSPEELNSIQARLNDIGFFSYPDTLIVQTSRPVYSISPAQTFFLKVKNGSLVKSVFWCDCMPLFSDDLRATRLREAIRLITTIIEAKREYRQLPPARGGYL